MSQGWEIHRGVGDVAAFHAENRLDAPVSRTATFVRADRPTLVLGSSQPVDRIDADEARRRGVEVTSRRSGGGAVLLVPGEFVWLDLRIGADDPLWSTDVARAMVWVGALWVAALADLGVVGRVHDGAFEPSRWSSDVCWSGLGTGEVVDDVGAKIVGISQRRSRSGARFQSMAHLTWRPDLVAALVASPAPTPDELAPMAVSLPVADATVVETALIAHLP